MRHAAAVMIPQGVTAVKQWGGETLGHLARRAGGQLGRHRQLRGKRAVPINRSTVGCLRITLMGLPPTSAVTAITAIATITVVACRQHVIQGKHRLRRMV